MRYGRTTTQLVNSATRSIDCGAGERVVPQPGKGTPKVSSVYCAKRGITRQSVSCNPFQRMSAEKRGVRALCKVVLYMQHKYIYGISLQCEECEFLQLISLTRSRNIRLCFAGRLGISSKTTCSNKGIRRLILGEQEKGDCIPVAKNWLPKNSITFAGRKN